MRKVSVIIPAYNMADLTVRTVESVLKQTYENIEVIVIDDGSTDNTRERLASYTDRIKYIYKENGGACSARNMGIRLATGDYIGLLDCDDMYLPHKIEKSVNYLEKHPDFGFVHTPVYFIDENDTILRLYALPESRSTGWIVKKLLSRNFICNSTSVIRRSCFEKTGLFDEALFTHADWDISLRLAEKYKVGYISTPFTYYRKSTGYILKHLEQSKKEGLAVLQKAFERNPHLSTRLKKKLVSDVYLRNAVGYLRIGSVNEAKDKLVLSVKKCAFNLKALFLLLAVTILGKNLILILKRLKVI